MEDKDKLKQQEHYDNKKIRYVEPADYLNYISELQTSFLIMNLGDNSTTLMLIHTVYSFVLKAKRKIILTFYL